VVSEVNRLSCSLLLISLLPVAAYGQAAAPPSWNRDVRPILAANCFECHGPDEQTRESDLRFDVREAAIEDRGGYAPIVPGNADESELIARITSDDESMVMPPVDSNRSLTPEQIEVLRRWVEAGAEYEPHWSFVAPVRPAPSDVQNDSWVRNEIDCFILARLESEDLKASPEADAYSLVRRVYLDLIGLPPTPEQADAFVNDSDPLAYERLVDELLQSPHYGERWARQWLDLARYADTNGYEKDRERSIWPYRDWVIEALNNDMPFDQFTIEQLAGDMLPEATLAQRIATGFHRNTMINEEGGIDPLEYRYYAMVDRVATTGTVWMGLTTGCAQCHTHKFDPITHTDYYSMMALLNNADEPDLLLPDQTVAGRRAEIEGQIDQLIAELPAKFPPLGSVGLEGAISEQERRQRHLEQKLAEWTRQSREGLAEWQTVRPTQMETNLPRLEVLDDGSIFSTGDITKRDVFDLRFEISDSKSPITALRLEVLPDDRLPAGGPGRAYYEGRKGDFFLSEVSATRDDAPVTFVEPSRSFGKISVGAGTAEAANVIDGNGDTGWSTSTREGERHTLVLNFAEPIDTPATLNLRMLFERHFAASLGRFRFSITTDEGTARAVDLPLDVEQILTADESTWSPEQHVAVRRAFLLSTPELAEARKPIEKLRSQMPDPVTTMVLQERPADNRRATHLHHRGEYLQTREEVAPAVPELFPAIPGDARADRLSFARWLVSDANPLVGRVTVNRAWQAFFGRGLVATSADFGTQGELPSHPDLLDWLAVEFVARGWSMKQLHRLIVTSATYRQSSHVSPELLKRDPLNILLARGPRFRVNAETVRDIGLLASGLLSPKVAGPSVYPPQPASVTALAYGNAQWKPTEGEDRYRRSLYTFSKRTAPFAAYSVFDAPTGESCIARRERSNTALQALTMLNDPMFLEMAEALAAEAVSRETISAETVSRETDPGSDSERSSADGVAVGETVSRETRAGDRATFIVRRCLTRPPTDDELQALTTFAADQQQRFESGELDAAKICTSHPPSAELAAWTMVARAVLNLDETITKP
jgi:mono/diheme cytochrome c family protein